MPWDRCSFPVGDDGSMFGRFQGRAGCRQAGDESPPHGMHP